MHVLPVKTGRFEAFSGQFSMCFCIVSNLVGDFAHLLSNLPKQPKSFDGMEPFHGSTRFRSTFGGINLFRAISLVDVDSRFSAIRVWESDNFCGLCTARAAHCDSELPSRSPPLSAVWQGRWHRVSRRRRQPWMVHGAVGWAAPTVDRCLPAWRRI